MTDSTKVLVIDDDDSVRKVLTSALEDEGYAMDSAHNGSEAIRKCNVNFYNLALVDIRLLDMEGTKLLTEMKETTPKMVKIIVTGYPELQNGVDAANRGLTGA